MWLLVVWGGFWGGLGGLGWFCVCCPGLSLCARCFWHMAQIWPYKGTLTCKLKTRARLVLWVVVVVGCALVVGPWLVVWPLVLSCRFGASVTFRLRRSPAVMPCPSGLVLFPALLPYARRAVAGGPGGLVWRVVVLGLLFGLLWVPFCSRLPCTYETRPD